MATITDAKVVTVDPGATAWEIADEMDAHGVGSVVVVDAGAPVGIVTDRDLVRRVIAADRDESKTTAADVMSDELVVGSPSDSLPELLEIMRQRHIRRIPIVDDGKLVGLLSFDDAVVQLAQTLDNVSEAIRVELRETARNTAARRRREARDELIEEARGFFGELEHDARTRVESEVERFLALLRGDKGKG